MLPKNLAVCDKLLNEIGVAESFMAGVDFDSFESNEMLKRAVCMTVVNIGELVKNLDDGFRADHPEVPWKAIAGFRDVAAHKYQTLRMADVYATVKGDFPELREMLGAILDAHEVEETGEEPRPDER